MKYASSIRYGGQLIDASDCDYQDYKYLGLLCPNCKDPVFLQAKSIRSLEEKIVAVPAHFKHFAVKDPALVKQCETRVAKYKQKELDRQAASARNQRLKFLQRWFWELFLNKAVCINSPGTFGKEGMLLRIQGILDDENVIVLPREVEFPLKYKHLVNILFPSRENIETWKKEAYQYRSHLNSHIDGYLDNPVGDWVKTIELIKSKLDIKFHRLILREIGDFLFAKSSTPLLEKCLIFSYIHSFYVREWFLEQVDQGYPVGSVLLCDLAMHLLDIPWAEEFTLLQKQDVNHARTA